MEQCVAPTPVYVILCPASLFGCSSNSDLSAAMLLLLPTMMGSSVLVIGLNDNDN